MQSCYDKKQEAYAAEDEDVVALNEQVVLNDTTDKKKNGVKDERI